MIRHFFIGPAFPNTTDKDLDYVLSVLRNLSNIVPQIKTLSVEKSLGLVDEPKGIVLMATFENEVDFKTYFKDPNHLREGEKIKAFIDLEKMTVTQTNITE